MNSQEKKIVVAGVVITALSSAGFSMVQGDFNYIDDNYQSPTIVSEKTLASNDSTSINLVKTDEAIVDENNEKEEVEVIELKAQSYEEVKPQANTLNKTLKPKKDTSASQNKIEPKPTKPEEKPIKPETVPEKPEEKPTESETVPEKPEEKPTEPEIVPEKPEEKPTEPETVPEKPEEKPTEPEIVPDKPEEKPTEPEVSSTDSLGESISQIETPSLEI
ncbi:MULTISPECIES: hypothetical protein [Romboutsia]|jgi:hypothetical protein|uniref:hypothetical protein n=1 Tax=Romboutsia TaxID=1501226 RepID=UPI0023F05819|nr:MULTISPECIES: hypothetical protein [Romboutsia]